MTTVDYANLTNEKLITLFQQGDDYAFTSLFLRFQNTMVKQAEIAAASFPRFDFAEFFGCFQDKFKDLAERFDVSKGVYFAMFFKLASGKWASNYVRSHTINYNYSRDNELKPAIKEQFKHVSLDNCDRVVMSDDTFTYGRQMEVEDTGLFIYLKDKSEVYAKVASLLTQGYAYGEIALMCGRTGTHDALKAWTGRVVKNIRKEAEVYAQIK